MKLLRTAGALVLAGLAATACSAGGEPPADPVPTPEPSASTPASPPASPRATPDERPVVGEVASNGLTVRYQDRDGSVKTLRVEDFRR